MDIAVESNRCSMKNGRIWQYATCYHHTPILQPTSSSKPSIVIIIHKSCEWVGQIIWENSFCSFLGIDFLSTMICIFSLSMLATDGRSIEEIGRFSLKFKIKFFLATLNFILNYFQTLPPPPLFITSKARERKTRKGNKVRKRENNAENF